MKRLIKIIQNMFTIQNSIWLLYRIENNELRPYGYYTDFDKAKKMADAGEYLIKECIEW